VALQTRWTFPVHRRLSRFDGLNFDYATSSNTFNCINKFFYPYLPIHHTTFMALRFVLRPFTLTAHCKAFLGQNFSKVRKF